MKDLEKAAKEYAERKYPENTYPGDIEYDGVYASVREAFIDGARWMVEENVNPRVGNLLEQQLKRACDVVGVEMEETKRKCRKQEVVLARQLYCYLAKMNVSGSYKKIGKMVNIDHASVSHHLKKVNEYIQVGDAYFMSFYSKL